MLTKDDLTKIRALVREKVENESQSVKSHTTIQVFYIRARILDVKNKVKNLEIQLENLYKEMTGEKRNVTKRHSL